MADVKLEATRLMDTDEPVGINGWPLACYIAEAVGNEMATFSARERRRSYEDRFRLAITRVANNAGSYAEGYHIDPLVFRAAVDGRRL